MSASSNQSKALLLVSDKVSEASEFLGIFFQTNKNPFRSLRKALLKLQKHPRLSESSDLIGGIQSAETVQLFFCFTTALCAFVTAHFLFSRSTWLLAIESSSLVSYTSIHNPLKSNTIITESNNWLLVVLNSVSYDFFTVSYWLTILFLFLTSLNLNSHVKLKHNFLSITNLKKSASLRMNRMLA